jgi:hypothetical protein
MNSNFVVELVLCRPKAGVTDAELRAAAEASKDDLAALPGLVRRELLLDGEGQWVDVVHWESMEHATNALKLVEGKPNVMRLFSLLDQERMQMFHLSPVLVHEGEAVSEGM